MPDNDKPDEIDVTDTTASSDETETAAELEVTEPPEQPEKGEVQNPWETISASLSQSIQNLSNRLAALEADRQARQTAPEPEPEELEVEVPPPPVEEPESPPKSRKQARRENRKRGFPLRKSQNG